MLQKALLIVGCLLFGWLTYDALFVAHYDLDPTSVLASLLGIHIPTLGYISGAIFLVLVALLVRRFRAA